MCYFARCFVSLILTDGSVEPQLEMMPQQHMTATETPPLQLKRQSDGIDEQGMVK